MSNIMFKDGKPIGGIPQKGQSVTIPFMTKLWENPDPTASMAENVNINLSSSDYDYLLIEYSRYSSESNSFRFSAIAEKGISTILECAIATSNGTRSAERALNYINDSRLISKSAYIATGATARSEDNACIIPLTIYGLKKSYAIENVAIANVSTSATQCIMSDNVTTVEDRITGKDSVLVTADGVKTYKQLIEELYNLTDFDKLSVKSILKLNGIIYQATRASSTYARFTFTEVTTSEIQSETIRFQSSSSYFKSATTASGTTFTDLGSQVATSGVKIELIY